MAHKRPQPAALARWESSDGQAALPNPYRQTTIKLVIVF
jgi:hypothetical protein